MKRNILRQRNLRHISLSLLYWLLPSFFCWWLYRDGLRAWFQEDDFAWLGMHAQVFDWRTLGAALMQPTTQGTLRPWSERGFFILFWHWFGFDAFPYRLFVFVVQFGNLILLSWIVLRVTRSRVAGLLATLLWTANSALTLPMVWTSGYNQIQCAGCLLGAFALWILFEETGKWRYYWLQIAVFLAGFTVLELNLVYPAIAVAWGLYRQSRRLVLLAAPLFGVSGLFWWAHSLLAPRQVSGPYAMHFDSAIFSSLATYWQWTLVPPTWPAVSLQDPVWATVAIALLTVWIAWYCIGQALQKNYLPLFFIAWFLITLAPLLPLRDHLSDYYVGIPSLGIAVVLALSITHAFRDGSAWGKRRAVQLFATLATVAYLAVQIPTASFTANWNFHRSREVRNLVLGTVRAHELHPAETILLADVSDDVYQTAFVHKPFRNVPGINVYLAPSSRHRNEELPAEATLRALQSHRLVVYSAAAEPLRNVTVLYAQTAPRLLDPEPARMVEPASPLTDYLLGTGWDRIEGVYRWTRGSAHVRLGVPRQTGSKLIVTGYCAEDLTRQAPVYVNLAIDGRFLSRAQIHQPSPFHLLLDLPAVPSGTGAGDLSLTPTRANGSTGADLRIAISAIEVR